METLDKKQIELIAEIVAEKLKENFQDAPVGRWLTMNEALEYAKVKSVKTLKKWINKGYIYGDKRTGSWIIDRQSIDDWYSSDSDLYLLWRLNYEIECPSFCSSGHPK